jgi:hypothetical protein
LGAQGSTFTGSSAADPRAARRNYQELSSEQQRSVQVRAARVAPAHSC